MRVSTNAGHNLCEWFFYNSLAEGSKRGIPLNVAFVHVPLGISSEELKAAVAILEHFIGSLEEQIEKQEDPFEAYWRSWLDVTEISEG